MQMPCPPKVNSNSCTLFIPTIIFLATTVLLFWGCASQWSHRIASSQLEILTYFRQVSGFSVRPLDHKFSHPSLLVSTTARLRLITCTQCCHCKLTFILLLKNFPRNVDTPTASRTQNMHSGGSTVFSEPELLGTHAFSTSTFTVKKLSDCQRARPNVVSALQHRCMHAHDAIGHQ